MAQVPPSLQELVNRFNQTQAQLQTVILRKQQYEAELREVEKAVVEMEKLSPDAKIYKNVGNFLIQVVRDSALQELKDRKELLELHLKTLTRQESMLREQIEKLRNEINKEITKAKGQEVAKGGG